MLNDVVGWSGMSHRCLQVSSHIHHVEGPFLTFPGIYEPWSLTQHPSTYSSHIGTVSTISDPRDITLFVEVSVQRKLCVHHSTSLNLYSNIRARAQPCSGVSLSTNSICFLSWQMTNRLQAYFNTFRLETSICHAVNQLKYCLLPRLVPGLGLGRSGLSRSERDFIEHSTWETRILTFIRSPESGTFFALIRYNHRGVGHGWEKMDTNSVPVVLVATVEYWGCVGRSDGRT